MVLEFEISERRNVLLYTLMAMTYSPQLGACGTLGPWAKHSINSVTTVRYLLRVWAWRRCQVGERIKADGVRQRPGRNLFLRASKDWAYECKRSNPQERLVSFTE